MLKHSWLTVSDYTGEIPSSNLQMEYCSIYDKQIVYFFFFIFPQRKFLAWLLGTTPKTLQCVWVNWNRQELRNSWALLAPITQAPITRAPITRANWTFFWVSRCISFVLCKMKFLHASLSGCLLSDLKNIKFLILYLVEAFKTIDFICILL